MVENSSHKRLAKSNGWFLNPRVDNPPAKLSQDITFEWSPELIGTCTRRYVLRKSRKTQVLSLVVLALGIFFVARGTVAGWVFIGVFVWLACLFLVPYLKTVKRAGEIPDRKVTVRIDPESIFLRTSQKESTLKWSEIKMIWSAPDVLMLFPQGSSQYIALPVTSLGEELRRYIETNIRQNGGKVD